MFKKLLVPVDGSASSKEALKLALAMTKQFGSEVMIVHVAEITPYSVLYDDITGWAAGYINEMVHKLEETGKKILGEAEEFARKESSKVKIRLEIGSPATAICEVAEQEKCDLIVMGNRGVSDLKGLFLGSVSHRVLQRSHCPVLLAKSASAAAGTAQKAGEAAGARKA